MLSVALRVAAALLLVAVAALGLGIGFGFMVRGVVDIEAQSMFSLDHLRRARDRASGKMQMACQKTPSW